MKLKTDWRHQNDLQRVAGCAESAHIDPAINCRVSANVGDIMAAALAAAGSYAFVRGGVYACETDYLAASGAVFPSDVTLAEMEAFNRATLRDNMDESAEYERYRKIARFFRRSCE